MVFGVEQRRQAGEEVAPRIGVEVADRAAEEGDQALAIGRRGSARGRARSRRPGRGRRGRGTRSTSELRGLVGDLLGDVDRDVGEQAAGVAHRAQQVAGLCRRAGAELDQDAGLAGGAEDLGGALGEDLALGERRVVLGELGDLLKELGAALIVEILRRQLLGLGREAGADVALHRLAAVGGEVDFDLDLLCGGLGIQFGSLKPFVVCGGADQSRSRAQRKPAKIWRRCGRSQLRKLGRIVARLVAQAPPRSTLWASPKKTSEYSG